MIRSDGRAVDELRETRIIPGAQAFAEGSVIVETGQTRVLCAATIEDGVPRFLKGTGQGWITAEYSMLPRATLTRTPRERGSSGLKTAELYTISDLFNSGFGGPGGRNPRNPVLRQSRVPETSRSGFSSDPDGIRPGLIRPPLPSWI